MSSPASNTQQVVAQLVRDFRLQPHPEGGFYRETYRATQGVQNASGQTRSASTCIYYLLEGRAYSAWHRIACDEIWHFYSGTSLKIHVLDDSRGLTTHTLGNPLIAPGALFQAVAPAHCWFAAELADVDSYALVGCTVAPGFEFSEFELADAAALQRHYPDHAALIARLGARA